MTTSEQYQVDNYLYLADDEEIERILKKLADRKCVSYHAFSQYLTDLLCGQQESKLRDENSNRDKKGPRSSVRTDHFNGSSAGTDRFDITRRSNFHTGQDVTVAVKVNGQYQSEEHWVTGTIDRILTNKPYHSRGMKVKLTDGTVGRVKKINDPC